MEYRLVETVSSNALQKHSYVIKFKLALKVLMYIKSNFKDKSSMNPTRLSIMFMSFKK